LEAFLTCLIRNVQQEKEAFDDLAMELELADEDQAVLYDRLHALVHVSDLITSYKVGEAFLHLHIHTAMKRLERDQTQSTRNRKTNRGG